VSPAGATAFSKTRIGPTICDTTTPAASLSATWADTSVTKIAW